MLALASDHVGLELKKDIMAYLDEKGVAYKDYGTFSSTRCDYPLYAWKAAEAVSKGTCERGLLFCGTGIGVCITANKVRGIRCAVCSEPYSARLSRQHNDANMLALGCRVVGTGLARDIVQTWLDGIFEAGRHAGRIEQISRIERGNNGGEV